MIRIPFSEIKVGEQYLYEESYLMQANVTVIEDVSSNEMYAFVVRVDEWLNGLGRKMEPGHTFTCSKRKDGEGAYLLKISFKPVGSMPEYYFLPQKEGDVNHDTL